MLSETGANTSYLPEQGRQNRRWTGETLAPVAILAAAVAAWSEGAWAFFAMVICLSALLTSALVDDARRLRLHILWATAAYVANLVVLFVLTDIAPLSVTPLLIVFLALQAVSLFFAERIAMMRGRHDILVDRISHLNHEVLRDPLTGAYNRRYLMNALERSAALANRGQVAFTVCVCDLDHFKRVNDRFGHAAGDRVLQRFVQAADGVLRSMDTIARSGGEEFVLLLMGADEEKAGRIVSRLAQALRHAEVDPDAPEFRISASYGIARFRLGESPESLLERADQAMYQAKHAGRDRTVVAAA